MNRIEEIRIKSGMSRAGIAAKCLVPYRTWQAWELGNRIPPGHVVFLLEYYLKHEGILREND